MSTDVRRVLNRYALRQRLGSGGGGTVWAGEDELLQRPVAVKALHTSASVPDEERTVSRERVLREARAAARLNHPNAVTVFDVFDEDGCAYIVMELVRGLSLEELVEREGAMDPPRAAEIGLQLLGSLEAAHAKGIVHRDVKPGNVLVTEDGSVKLTDFGIATVASDSRITASGIVLGSPSYIAPEQAREGGGQAAGDLWGLGATLYFSVEGCPPFERGQPLATVQAVLHEAPRPAERAGTLAPVLTDLLAKDPAARPSLPEVRRRLQVVAAGEAPAATAASSVEETQRVEEAQSAEEMQAVEEARPAEEMQPVQEAKPVEQAQPVERSLLAEEPAPGRAAPGRQPPAPTVPWWRRPAVVAMAAAALLLLAAVAGAVALREAPQDEVAQAPPVDPPVDPPADEAAPGEQEAAEGSPAEPPAAPADEQDAVEAVEGEEVPADWETYTHDLGWSIAHPPGWEILPREGNIVDIRDPQSPTYMRVDYTDDPPASAVDAWEELSASFARERTNYTELGIEPVTFKGFDGALWEYRYTEGGLDLRAANLGFGTDEFGQALNFQTTAADWDDAQGLHEAFRASFEPAAP